MRQVYGGTGKGTTSVPITIPVPLVWVARYPLTTCHTWWHGFLHWQPSPQPRKRAFTLVFEVFILVLPTTNTTATLEDRCARWCRCLVHPLFFFVSTLLTVCHPQLLCLPHPPEGFSLSPTTLCCCHPSVAHVSERRGFPCHPQLPANHRRYSNWQTMATTPLLRRFKHEWRHKWSVEGFPHHTHALCLPPTPLHRSKREWRGILVTAFLPPWPTPLCRSKCERRDLFITHMMSSCHQPPPSLVFLGGEVFLSPTCLGLPPTPLRRLKCEQRGFLVTHMAFSCHQPPSIAWYQSGGVFFVNIWTWYISFVFNIFIYLHILSSSCHTWHIPYPYPLKPIPLIYGYGYRQVWVQVKIFYPGVTWVIHYIHVLEGTCLGVRCKTSRAPLTMDCSGLT